MRVLRYFMFLTLTTVIAFAESKVFVIHAPNRISVDPYQISTKNVTALSDLKEKGIKVVLQNKNDVTTSSSSLLCRGWFPIVTPQSDTFEGIIVQSLSQELAQSGILSEHEGITLSIDKIKTNFNTVGTANWEYEMTVSRNGKAETFTYKHEFGVFFVAVNVCNATGQNFTRGLEAFLSSLYKDPRFLSLLN